MRTLGIAIVLAATACSSSPGDGAVLTFAVPEGPTTASRIELVLASADPASFSMASQRMRPDALGVEDVVYYRQRAPGGSLADVELVDGFTLRIEPYADLVPDESFIPFALIYDASDTLIAVGTVNDASGAPSAVMIKPGVVSDYTVTIQAVTPDTDQTGLGVGQGHAVVCASDRGSWTSGAAWRPAIGAQVRLLLPDLDADPAATDATARAADLDCDVHAALDEDCDDLRGAFHEGQTETCDGLDTDCDGRRMEVISGCSLSTSTCGGQGVSFCAEGGTPGGNSTTTCQPDATCACGAPGVPPMASCRYCSFDWRDASGLKNLCAPAVGKIHQDGCLNGGCMIEIASVVGPWEIKIGPDEIGPFQTPRVSITNGYFYLRAKYTAGMTSDKPAGTSVGAVYLMATQGTVQTPIAIDLQLAETADSQCTPLASGTTLGNVQMTCLP